MVLEAQTHGANEVRPEPAGGVEPSAGQFFSPGEVHQIIVMTHEQLTHGALTKEKHHSFKSTKYYRISIL